MRLLVFPFMLGLCGLLFSLYARPYHSWPAHHSRSDRIEVQVDEHTIVVTGCDRRGVPLVEQMEATSDGEAAYRFAPCPDAVLLIEGNRLSVNGISYGILEPDDSVFLHHDAVFVDGVRRAAPSK